MKREEIMSLPEIRQQIEAGREVFLFPHRSPFNTVPISYKLFLRGGQVSYRPGGGFPYYAEDLRPVRDGRPVFSKNEKYRVEIVTR